MATAEPSSEQRQRWLNERRSGIGASEAAAAIGVSPYKSPFQLWSEKVGLIEPPDISDREPVRWGTLLEPVVAAEYQERSGRSVRLWPAGEVVLHVDKPHILCTPDATQEDAEFGKGLLQIKTAGMRQESKWEDEPPLHYQVQCQHEMACVNAQWTTLCVLFGGQRMSWYDIDRNDRFIEALIPQLDAFWDKVILQQPPEVDGSQATRDALARLYPDDTGESVPLPLDAIDWDIQLQGIKAKERELKGQRTLLENRLWQSMGNAAYGVLPDGTRYSLKSQTRKSYEVAETTFRVLRRLSR